MVAPGVAPDARFRRRGRIAALIALPVIAIYVVGGAWWWQGVDLDYQRTMYRPLAGVAHVTVDAQDATLDLTVSDTTAATAPFPRLMPDHGKVMHLFLVRDSSLSAFAHLHPIRHDGGPFTAALPPLPAGRYRLFADVVLETGADYTVTTLVDLPMIPVTSTMGDPDDAFVTDVHAATATAGARDTPFEGSTIEWDGASTVVANHAEDLRFTVRDRNGAVATLEPYLGMAGHAVVMRTDGSVYVHLHPTGTVPLAAQQAFVLRDNGDTATDGRLMVRDSSGMSAMPMIPMDGSVTFPYEFPTAGAYRMWVQVKTNGRILTGAFDVPVRR